jgi:hypothetical protein
MNLLKHFPRLAAAALFAATASTSVVVADATHAGAPTTSGILASAPQKAEASVFVGVGFGPNRYWRYGYRGGSWVRLGYYYGRAPGYIPGGYYVGYGPPAYAYGYGYRHPYYGGYRGYYGHPYYGGYRGYGYGHVGYYGGGGTHVSVGLRF